MSAEVIEIRQVETVVIAPAIADEVLVIAAPAAELVAIEGETVVVDGGAAETVTIEAGASAETIVVASPAIEILEVAEQGPAGPPGGTSEEVMYARRTDDIDDATIYIGEALPGALDSDPVWRIRRVTFGEGEDDRTEWAGGTDAFDKAWADRLTLEYR